MAAAELDVDQVVTPVRATLRKQRNDHFMLGEVTGIYLAGRAVTVAGQRIGYDYLILANATTSAFMGTPGAAEHAFPLRTLDESLALRSHMLERFEQASLAASVEERRRHLTFMIVGGGPTGVEFAGALSELVRGPLTKDFDNLNLRDVRIVLLESHDRILAHLPDPGLSAYAAKRLTKMGIEVRTSSRVQAVEPGVVTLKDGTRIEIGTTVWTAGVEARPLAKECGLPVNM
ncbi:MAG: FAD-dependent oxidoreductase, partial [SAR202 cluster bacterium]|nr:FAD-dependent oxidoreductase [SAR202 cluster bacterium]